MRIVFGPFSVRIQTAFGVTANSYVSGTFIRRGKPAGVPQVVPGSGNAPFFARSLLATYFASHSALYGGNSRGVTGSLAPAFGGRTVARSKMVPPCIAHTPLQSGSVCADPAAPNSMTMAIVMTVVRMIRPPLLPGVLIENLAVRAGGQRPAGGTDRVAVVLRARVVP